jgi:hypothetical protein
MDKNFKLLKSALTLNGFNPDAYRFLIKVKPSSTSECWEWTGATQAKGYGRFKSNGKIECSHRFSYKMFIGNIPKGMNVCHKCDNPKCVNPEHLFVGTQSDNMVDCRDKGRLVIPDGGNFKDEHKPHNSSTDTETIKQIKASIDNGYSNTGIAAEYGVKNQLVRDIRRGKSYQKY